MAARLVMWVGVLVAILGIGLGGCATDRRPTQVVAHVEATAEQRLNEPAVARASVTVDLWR